MIIFEAETVSAIYFFKLACIIFLPIFSFIILRRNLHNVEDLTFQKKYGSIYLNLYPLKHTVYQYTPLFCVKRLLFAMSTAIFFRPIIISISVYIYGSLFSIGYYLNNRPMNTRIIQILDTTNEFFILVSGYAIILFSNWIYNFEYNRDADDISDLPLLKYNIGYVYISFLGLSVAVNLCLIIFEIGKAFKKQNLKRVYYKKWGEHFK